MDQSQINQLGDELYQAMLKREAVSPLTSRGFDISIDDAYHISLRMLQNRLPDVYVRKVTSWLMLARELAPLWLPKFRVCCG